MLNFIKSFFKKPSESKKSHFVIFDGDQVSRSMLLGYLDKIDRRISKPMIVEQLDTKKKLKGIDIEVVQASKMAKEAVDTMIAIQITKEILSNPDLKEVHVVSSDGDCLGIAANILNIAPEIKFFIYRRHVMQKAKRTLKIPNNVHVITVKD